uniref:Uncharacterized protein n=1 Tax=Salix viminalis TaxID=40686 RepID=A0A6N2KE69_SALVM
MRLHTKRKGKRRMLCKNSKQPSLFQ